MSAVLHPHHREMLERDSGIKPDIIAARGYKTVTTKADLKQLGFSERQCNVPTLLIPVYDPRGEVATYQSRPDSPRIKDGKPIKYETPARSSVRLDVHPSMRGKLDDPKAPLFITEGVKKGDALVSHGLTAIALLGVWNWRGKNDKGGKTALAEWESIALNGRQVYIVFDSDVMEKAAVYGALVRLKAFLESRGATVRLIYLPSGEGAAKCGVDDYLASGKSVDDLLTLATSELKTPPKDEEASGDLPVIMVTNRFLRDIADEALQVLEGLELYTRAGLMVRINGGVAERLTNAPLKGILERAANFMKEVSTQEGGSVLLPAARVPGDLPADILSLPARDLPFPKLTALASSPVLLPSGTLLSQDGYDPESGILLQLEGLSGLRHDMSVDEAVGWLDDLIGEFPFVDEASRAHTTCLLIQPTVRHVIKGATPIYGVDAPSKGTGKGLLIDICCIVQTGRTAPVMPYTPGEELEKRITTRLLDGSTHILLDNLTELGGSVLPAVLTSEIWRGRILGRSEMVHVHNGATWIASGNNVELSDEMARRWMPIRLDAGVEHPEERKGFKHPKLKEWTLEHRAELLSAVLSIVKAWADVGMPKGNKSIGSFESWAGVMGGILEVSGVSGLLGGRERLRSQAEKETAEWVAFTKAWYEAYEQLPVTAKDLFEVLKASHLLLDLWGGRKDIAAMQRLGRSLKHKRDRVYGSFKILAAGQDGVTNSNTYRLFQQGGKQTTETPETKTTPSQTQTSVGGFGGV